MILAIPLIVILAVLVAYGSATLTRSTHAGLIKWLADQVLSTIVGGKWIASQIVKLASYVAHELGPHFTAMEHTAATWLASLANYVDYIGKATLLLPYEFSRFAYWLVRTEIPRLVKAYAPVVSKITHAVVSRVVRVERTIVKLPKLSEAQAKRLVAAAVAGLITPYLIPLRWLKAHLHAFTAVLPHVITAPFGRTIAQIKKRLRALERATPSALAVAAVAAALGRLGLGWLKCRNPKKAGKALCGVPFHFFDDVLGLFTDYMVLSNICRVLPWLEEGASAVASPLVAQLSKAGAGACAGGAKPMKRMQLPAITYPVAVEL